VGSRKDIESVKVSGKAVAVLTGEFEI